MAKKGSAPKAPQKPQRAAAASVGGVALPLAVRVAPPKAPAAAKHAPAHVHKTVERLRADLEKRGKAMFERTTRRAQQHETQARLQHAAQADALVGAGAPGANMLSHFYPTGLPQGFSRYHK